MVPPRSRDLDFFGKKEAKLMMLVRSGQAALIAAILTFSGNTVWAQAPNSSGSLSADCCQQANCCEVKHACATGKCCKNGKCCKDADCCYKDGKCCGSKDKTNVAKAGCGCPFLSKLTKRTAIILVMPSSLPLPVSCCLEAMGMLPHPPLPVPLPAGPHVFLPPMPSPIPAPYAEPTYGYEAGSLKCIPPVCVSSPVVACGITTPATAAKVCIRATPSGDRLEMGIGEETSIRCKKMTITVNDKEMTVSRFDDRVRIRGADLKATADCVRTEGKDRLILEGDVVLHYKRDGHSANVTGERIELNLSNSALTIQRGAKTTVTPAVYEK